MINVLYIAVGDGGSDVALLSLIAGLKGKVNPYVTLGKFATRQTIDWLESHHIPYCVWQYDFFWYSSKKTLRKRLFRPIEALKLRHKHKQLTKRVITLCKSRQIDLIHTNSSAYQFGLAAAQALRIPHVWHLREYQTLDFGHPHAYSFAYLKKQLGRSGNFNIAITQGIYDFYRLQASNATVIYDGVLSRDYSPQAYAKENYYLFVGRLDVEKGVLLLLDSYIRYRREGGTYRLVLAGSCSPQARAEIEAQVKEAGLQRDVTLTGAVPVAEIYGWMGRATALVVPSRFEAFGLVTAEAMFNRCLVIGRDTGGTQEQFDNGRKRYHQEIGIRFNDGLQLSACLTEVESKGLAAYHDVICRAYDTASALYPTEQNVEQAALVYQRLLP